MGLTLSSGDFARLEVAFRVLLSPLAAASLDDWRQQEMLAVSDLFQADSSLFSLPHTGLDFYASTNVDASATRTMSAYIANVASRRGGSPDPLIDAFYRKREELGLEVFNLEMMCKLIDNQHVRSEFFQRGVERTDSHLCGRCYLHSGQDWMR